MVTIGTDSHKRTHTFAVVDANGAQVATTTLKATPGGHLEALKWANQWPERTWALEDCRQLSRRLEADLLRAGERVKRVPPKLMAGVRRSARESGKSDPIDALAVARAALREPDLPFAQLEGVERELRVLVDHREDLVAERTRAQNRLRWHLHDLDPEFAPPARTLDRFKVLDDVADVVGRHGGAVAQVSAELVEDIRRLTRRIKDLEYQIAKLVAPLAPGLLALYGCAELGAAKAIAETAGVRRFRSKAAFARHNGTAPIPVWSGNETRHRLNRGGNRQLNAVMHRIAITQLRVDGPARDYLAKRISGGDSKTEAIRALKRRISDEVYRRLVDDERCRHLERVVTRGAA